jgi:hypothetical protein
MVITLGVVCKKYNKSELTWEAILYVQSVDVCFDGEKVVLNASSPWLIVGAASS